MPVRVSFRIRQNGCLSKILTEAPQTIGQCKQAIASLIIIDSAFLLSKNKDVAASLYKIKSERFKKKLTNKVLILLIVSLVILDIAHQKVINY